MRFIRTYLIALVALCVVGAIAVGAVAAQRLLQPDYSGQRPSPAGLESYSLSYVGPSASGTLTVDLEGAACRKLKPSDYLLSACTLALNKDPAFIAGDAAGDLNNTDTPSYEAILWRAKLDADPTVCDRGGLLEERLANCHAVAASTTPHEVSRDGVTVSISAS